MRVRSVKEAAKNALSGNWGIAIGVFFINLIIGSIIGAIPEQNDFLYLLAFFFISGPLSVGYSWFHLALKREENPSVGALFSGFQTTYFRNALTNLFISLFVLLWSLLLIIPGIIKSLAYSMTFFILRDHPDLTALQAITESRRIMNGKKKDLFLLLLSFIIWLIIPIVLIILGIISIAFGAETTNGALAISGMGSMLIGTIAIFGISIYLTPYIMTTLAVFYDDYAKPTETLTNTINPDSNEDSFSQPN